MMERNAVRTFLYPTFFDPPPSLAFWDQFAFHPNGSTSAAIISLLHTVINLLQFNPFDVVISLDFFSKAFDTIRHSTLLSKLAELDLLTPVYTTGWWTYSAATRTIPCSVKTSRAREASRPASHRARALDQPPTLSQLLISDRSTPTTYSSSSPMTLTSSSLSPTSAQGGAENLGITRPRQLKTSITP